MEQQIVKKKPSLLTIAIYICVALFILNVIMPVNILHFSWVDNIHRRLNLIKALKADPTFVVTIDGSQYKYHDFGYPNNMPSGFGIDTGANYGKFDTIWLKKVSGNGEDAIPFKVMKACLNMRNASGKRPIDTSADLSALVNAPPEEEFDIRKPDSVNPHSTKPRSKSQETAI